MYRWFRLYFNFLFWFSFISTIGCWYCDQFITAVKSIYRFLGGNFFSSLFQKTLGEVSKPKMNHIWKLVYLSFSWAERVWPLIPESVCVTQRKGSRSVFVYGSDSAFSTSLLASTVDLGVMTSFYVLSALTGAYYNRHYSSLQNTIQSMTLCSVLTVTHCT